MQIKEIDVKSVMTKSNLETGGNDSILSNLLSITRTKRDTDCITG